MSNYQKSELDIREKYRNRCEGNGLSPRISAQHKWAFNGHYHVSENSGDG